MDRLRGSTCGGSRIGTEKTVQLVTNNGQRHDRRRHSLGGGKSMWAFMVMAMFMLCGTPVLAREIAYCSELNTGEDYDLMQSPYQSHGLCFDHCNGQDYAFAVLQGQSCWCSDYAPEGKKADCDQSCPGYPSEICGSTSKAAYVYLGTGKQPAGTTDGSTKTTVSSTSYTKPQVSTVTTVNDALPSTVTIKPSKTSTPSKTTTSSNDSNSPTLTVITKVGEFQTVTISPTSVSDAASSETKSTQGGLAPGGIAGLVIGLILLIALIIAGTFFWRHRRQRGLEAVYDSETSNGTVVPTGGAGILAPVGRRRSRSMSTLGLIGEKTNGSPTATQRPGHAAGGITPISENGASSPAKPGAVYDPRLDPGQLFMRFDRDTGSSRMSVRSLRDDTDYSRRVLRLANPDD